MAEVFNTRWADKNAGETIEFPAPTQRRYDLVGHGAEANQRDFIEALEQERNPKGEPIARRKRPFYEDILQGGEPGCQQHEAA